MSTKYRHTEDVPTEILCERLGELSGAVSGNRVNHEFTMRIPAEVDRDADLVLDESARRLNKLDGFLREIVAAHNAIMVSACKPELQTLRNMSQLVNEAAKALGEGE